MIRGSVRGLTVALVWAALALGGGVAKADKATDTLRLAVDQPIRLIDSLQNPNPEANLVDRAVLDVLVGYDVKTKTYRSQLAESWKQIDGKTLEIKLRRGAPSSQLHRRPAARAMDRRGGS
jgi:peptide/nickel transport system substrate-binding protein